jgi:hypothetical protein
VLLAAMESETESADTAISNCNQHTREAATDALFANWDWNALLRSGGRS